MERVEAASFLGVSLSTLDRFASQGRLTRGRAKKKTKPVTVFDKEQLESLKKELQVTKPAEVFRRVNTEKPQDAVGFRLDPYYVARLKEEGESKGMSVGEYARRLVIQGLEGGSSVDAGQQVQALRSDLTQMFYLILVEQFRASEEDAKAFVKKYMGAS